MTTTNVYISFNGNCREAMTFYKECVGGELELNGVEGTPLESEMPADKKDSILHATLIKDGTLLLAGSDLSGPDGIIQGNNMTIFVTCSDRKEVDTFYASLSQGAKFVHCVPGVQFWGGYYAGFVDKYGNGWALNCA